MSDVSIKVKYPDNSTKSIRMSPDKFIADLVEEVRAKAAGDENAPADSFGLFQAAAKGRGARWLLPNRTLKFYGINSSGVRFLRPK